MNAKRGELMILRINIADLTKLPPLVTNLLIKQKDIAQLGIYCKGNRIDDCWQVIGGSSSKLNAIKDILKCKGVRVEELKNRIRGETQDDRN